MSLWWSDHQARQATARRLGTEGEIIARTPGGSPILQVGVHRLAYRRHGSMRYWRQAVPCAGCGVHILFGDTRVETGEDLAELRSLEGHDLLCHRCQKTLLRLQ